MRLPRFFTILFLTAITLPAWAADPPAKPVKPNAAKRQAEKQEAEADPLEGKLWERFSDDEQAAHVARLKKFAEGVHEKLGVAGLRFYETKFLLLGTDLDPAEAKKWQVLLGRMYDRMLEMFDLPAETNVWRGKAVVFIFKSREAFRRYENLIENHNPPETTAGVCHSGGDVHIAFYRQPDESAFATVLVHEASHGFIHRYRSAENPPQWVNEGMAEWISFQIVPQSKWKAGRVAVAKKMLAELGDTQGMFDDWKGEWQYGVAYTLTDFMINNRPPTSKRNYVRFIKAIKDGKPWREAMEEDYGVPLDRLVAAYGQTMGLQKPLKP